MNPRFQFIATLTEEGQQFALLFDTETQETIKSPMRGITEASMVAAPVKAPVKKSKVPAVFVEPSEEIVAEESVVEAPVPIERPKNPHAVANPRYAWQDPDWVSPEEKKKRMSVPPTHPTIGRSVLKMFNEPGKVSEQNLDFTPQP